jgi:hypothetical protein
MHKNEFLCIELQFYDFYIQEMQFPCFLQLSVARLVSLAKTPAPPLPCTSCNSSADPVN